MAILKDYLGTLVSSVNQARVSADIESANIAQQYADHNLLKHFSIPRMRMQNVEFTIPIAIENMETVAPKDYQPIDNKVFVSKVYDELTNIYKVKSFDRASSLKIRQLLFKTTDVLEKSLKSGENTEKALRFFSNNVAEQLLKIKEISKNIIKENIKEKNISNDFIIDKIIARAKPEIKPIKTQSILENANVIVEASKLKEQKIENMVFIKMTIIEEGMEWQTIEHENGEKTSKLLPE